MIYKQYTLHIDPLNTLYGCKICWIKCAGLTVDKSVGRTNELAIESAKRIIDYWKE